MGRLKTTNEKKIISSMDPDFEAFIQRCIQRDKAIFISLVNEMVKTYHFSQEKAFEKISWDHPVPFRSYSDYEKYVNEL